MLVLTRKTGEAINIGDDIEITVLEVKGDQVRIGINAPKSVTILRREIYQAVKQENRDALDSKHCNLENMADLFKNNK